MGLLYGIIIIVILLAIAEILAISLKLTGLDYDKARFQVISILSNTGFTTKESELITQHPKRRRIAEILMIISYVGTATIITIIINLFNLLQNGGNTLPIYIGLGIVILIIIIFRRNKWILNRIDIFIERQLLKEVNYNKKNRTVEEVLRLNDEFGVIDFVIGSKSNLLGKALKDSGLKSKMILVLNIDRGGNIIHFPNKDHVFEQGDKVLVYGCFENIKEVVMNK